MSRVYVSEIAARHLDWRSFYLGGSLAVRFWIETLRFTKL